MPNGIVLTIDRQPGLCNQFLFLSECPVPHDASVGGAVISLGRHYSQNRPSRLILVLSSDDLGIQHLVSVSSVEPVDLRWRGPSNRRAGQVHLFSFHSSDGLRGDVRPGRLEKDSKLNGLFVENSTGAPLFDPALKLAVVSIVGGVGDF